MKTFLKYCSIFIVLIALFVGTLCITSLIPSNVLKENVQESSDILLQESNRKKVFINSKNMVIEFDNFTDALMINTAYSIDSKTPLFSAFTAKKNYIPGVTQTIEQDSVSELKSSSKYNGYHNEVGELHDTANGEASESFEYARYWHGYLIILRPLLALVNVSTIRIILITIFILLETILFYLISKKIAPFVALFFLVGLVGVEYLHIGISLQGASIFLILMVSSIYILIRNEKIRNVPIMFFIIGMLTNFFDFLTVPILTYGVPLILYFLLQQKEKKLRFKESTIIFIKTGMNWAIGYVATWFSKWILMDLIYGRDLLETAIGQVLYRSGTGIDYSYTTILLLNIQYCVIPIIISSIIGIVATAVQRKTGDTFLEKIEQKYPYILIAIAPFIWYFLLKNHSMYHSFFTYRNLLLTIITIPIIISFSKETYNKKNLKGEKNEQSSHNNTML